MLALRFVNGLSESQVAELLGCSIGTVKSTASRALERLRRELGPLVGAEMVAGLDTDGPSEEINHREERSPS